jgi:hypothetical protein
MIVKQCFNSVVDNFFSLYVSKSGIFRMRYSIWTVYIRLSLMQ